MLELMRSNDKREVLDFTANQIFSVDRYNSSFFMALSSAPRRGKVAMLSGIDTCRERLVANYAKMIQESIQQRDERFLKRRVLMGNKFTLLVSRRIPHYWVKAEKLDAREKFFGGLARAGNLINNLEEIAKWPLTNIEEVNMLPYRKNKTLLMAAISGTSKWAKSPYFLSLYLLLVRLMRFPFPEEAFENLGLLKEVCDEVMEKKNELERQIHGLSFLNDVKHLLRVIDKLPIIMKGANRLLSRRSVESFYSSKFVGEHPYLITSGISNLMYSIEKNNSVLDYAFQRQFIKTLNTPLKASLGSQQ